MASQPLDGSKCVEVASFIRGYHAYKYIWQPRVSKVLLLEREPDNCDDKTAVAVIKSCTIVGHMPRHLSTLFSQFIRRICNKGVVQVTGEKVNRDGGHGLEVPCIYRLYGPEAYLDRLKKFLEDKEREDIAP